MSEQPWNSAPVPAPDPAPTPSGARAALLAVRGEVGKAVDRP